MAPALAILEGRDAALTCLETTAAAFPESLDYVDCSEEVRAFRGDPRFVALMGEVGHPARSVADR